MRDASRSQLLWVMPAGCGDVFRVSCGMGEAPARRGIDKIQLSSQGASVSSYPAAGRLVSVSADEGDLPAGVMVAVPVRCLASPLKNGAPVEAGDRSALVVAGTEAVRKGEPAVFLKVVAVAPAVV